MKKRRISFKSLLQYFPHVDLPIHLTDETHHVFSRENKILPSDFLHGFFIGNDVELDEFTEYLPCFRFDGLGDYVGLVLWKATLMQYTYILYTFDLQHKPIAQQVIAGTQSNGETMLTRQATIGEDGTISVVEGVGSADGIDYNATSTRSFSFELLTSGDILQQVDPLNN